MNQSKGQMTTLKRLRQQRRLSLRELGAILGCSYQSVWRYETNQTQPQPKYVRKLESVFDLPVETLLSNEKRAASE